MKALGLILTGLLCASAQAATSDALFPIGGTNFPGLAGNVLFNGEHFVTPTVQSNGAVDLVFLNTNGIPISNFSLAITGSTPRLAFDGSNYLLGWLDSNATLHSARITNNVAGSASSIATNVTAETFSLRAGSGGFLALWQSADSNSAIFARALDSNGVPLGDAFAVSPSASSQRYPSMNSEGTNCLVAWTEQNVSSNDWRVLARFVNEAGPFGSVIAISETNSLNPWPTACSFGSNYLVAWSWDEQLQYLDYVDYITKTGWFPMIHGRICSSSGMPQSNAFIIARFAHTNINPTLAFGDGRYLAAWAKSQAKFFPNYPASTRQEVQSLDSFGTPSQFPSASSPFVIVVKPPSAISGAKRFCMIYPLTDGISRSVILGPQTMEQGFVTLQRTTNGFVARSSPAAGVAQISTNLVHWTNIFLPYFKLTNWPAQGPLFVRGVDHSWPCVEQMRSLVWAKEQWRLDHAKVNTDTPTPAELFGPTKYLPVAPVCPGMGTYTLGDIQTRPTCSIGLNHTL